MRYISQYKTKSGKRYGSFPKVAERYCLDRGAGRGKESASYPAYKCNGRIGNKWYTDRVGVLFDDER